MGMTIFLNVRTLAVRTFHLVRFFSKITKHYIFSSTKIRKLLVGWVPVLLKLPLAGPAYYRAGRAAARAAGRGLVSLPLCAFFFE